MKEKRIRIIVIILLLSFIFLMMVSPSISAIVQNAFAIFALVQTVLLLFFWVSFFRFTEIILFTHKLE